jgi:DNA polymerase-3 subunit delta
MAALKSFAAVDRFLDEVASTSRRPGYVLAGNEIYLGDRCRRGVLDALIPADLREFSVHELDLTQTSIFEALDLAQTPSLMAPFQLLIIRGLKTLYGRGSKKEEFAAIDAYFRSPNPQALLLFIADHITIARDTRRMDMQDKERYERLHETLGDSCGMVELTQVSDEDATQWAIEQARAVQVNLQPDAARELVDALGADMMLVASELEKLLLYVGAYSSELSKGVITLGDVETMVLAAKQRSLYELTDAITAKDRLRAVALLHGLLNASDGGEDAAIGHIYMLARTFRQMLVILEKNKDRRDLMRALRLIARADLEIRSSPVDKRLVLERLVIDLASESKRTTATQAAQYAQTL